MAEKGESGTVVPMQMMTQMNVRFPMKIALLLFTLAGLVSCTLFQAVVPTGEATPTPTNGPSPTPYVFRGQQAVRLAYFYKPPKDSDTATLLKYFETFILTKNDESLRDELKAGGVTRPILQYLRFDAIMDPGSCEKTPWQNQVANRPGDFCTISAQYPDLFLLDNSCNRINDSESFYMMDPANPEWRAFFLERARESQDNLGWRGVFLDNVEGGLGKYKRYNKILMRYPEEAGYQSAIEGFLAYLYLNYFKPAGRPLYGNVIYLKNYDSEPLFRSFFRDLQYMDGAMVESWATDWEREISADEWESHLQLAEKAQAMGKDLILVAQGGMNDLQRQEFAFASYLLITEGRAAFRYSRAEHYKEVWLYPVYDHDLGIPGGTVVPITARYRNGDLWQRDFTNGSVTVDPKNHTATITIP